MVVQLVRDLRKLASDCSVKGEAVDRFAGCRFSNEFVLLIWLVVCVCWWFVEGWVGAGLVAFARMVWVLSVKGWGLH